MVKAQTHAVPLAALKPTRLKPGQIRLLLMTLPFVLFILVFSYIPLFGWTFSFFDYSTGVAFKKVLFVDLKYFRTAVDFNGASDLLIMMRNFGAGGRFRELCPHGRCQGICDAGL